MEVVAGSRKTIAGFFGRGMNQVQHLRGAAFMHFDVGGAGWDDAGKEHAAAVASKANASGNASHPGFAGGTK